jgi:hypothetical protein
MRFPYVMGNRNFTRPAHPQSLGPALMPVETVTVEQPKHPLNALTTYELAYYRRRLENALAFLDKQDPVPAIRVNLQAALDNVITEQQDRARLTAGA